MHSNGPPHVEFGSRPFVLQAFQPFTFAHLPCVSGFIPLPSSHCCARRGGSVHGGRHDDGRTLQLAGRLRVVRMLPRARGVRRRLESSIPSLIGGSRVAPAPAGQTLFFIRTRKRRELGRFARCAGRESNPRLRLGRPGSYRWTTRAWSTVSFGLALSLPQSPRLPIVSVTPALERPGARLAFRAGSDPTVSEASSVDQRLEFIDCLEELAHILSGVLKITGDAAHVSNCVSR